MEAYLVPLLAALGAALLTMAVLGAVRVGRWWSALRARAAHPRRTHLAAVPAPSSPERGPGVSGDAVDPFVSRLAHRALGAVLLLGLTALFLLIRDAGPSGGVARPAVLAAMLAAWLASRSRR